MKQGRFADAEQALKRAQAKGMDVKVNLQTLQEMNK
jgi:hypothetical protein